MKAILLSLATSAVLLTSGGVALAAPKHSSTTKSTATVATTTKPSYCGTTPYDLSYRAIYEYPTGSYWQSQIKAYPDYYAANNAYYLATYGC